MPLPLAVPLIGAGTQIANNAIDMWQNSRQRKFDKSMADYAYSKDLDMWNRANEYNSPKNQMIRFEDAGLNKNLIYSQGQPGNASSTMPKYQDVKGTFGVPGFQANNFANLINSYQDFEIKNKQKDLLKENIRGAQAENEIKEIQAIMWNPNSRLMDTMPFGLPKDRKSLAEYSLDAKDLDIQNKQKHLIKIGKETLNIEESTKRNKLLNAWQDMKNYNMHMSGMNIDHDQIMSRIILGIFGDQIGKFAKGIRMGTYKSEMFNRPKKSMFD